MITNFEEITENLTEEEKDLLPYLKKVLNKFSNRENAIKSENLCDIINQVYIMENGFDSMKKPMNGVRLRKLVNHSRREGIIPIIATSEGYFITFDQTEIEKQIKSLKERANGILKAAAGLETFITYDNI